MAAMSFALHVWLQDVLGCKSSCSNHFEHAAGMAKDVGWPRGIPDSE